MYGINHETGTYQRSLNELGNPRLILHDQQTHLSPRSFAST
jgi:hypothetical protein